MQNGLYDSLLYLDLLRSLQRLVLTPIFTTAGSSERNRFSLFTFLCSTQKNIDYTILKQITWKWFFKDKNNVVFESPAWSILCDRDHRTVLAFLYFVRLRLVDTRNLIINELSGDGLCHNNFDFCQGLRWCSAWMKLQISTFIHTGWLLVLVSRMRYYFWNRNLSSKGLASSYWSGKAKM